MTRAARSFLAALAFASLLFAPAVHAATTAEILAASTPADWRKPDPENTLYLDLPSGRVVIELAPRFAPKAVENVKLLAHEHYFDGLAVVRVQDNFVTQWADPDNTKPIGTAARTLAPEFTRAAKGLEFTRLPDSDTFAPEVGFVEGFPAARDRKRNEAWLAHCYGMVGVGRDNAADSGAGTELYAVIGHAPRQLDRNITVLGRVIHGIERLSSLPRGTAPMGMYDKPEQRVPITSVRIASEVPAGERMNLEILRTDTPRFAELIEARRNRRDDWYKVPAGRIDLCNVMIPVREAKP